MFLHLQPRHYFKKNTHYYICSFGGCGSWILAQYLSNFGIVHHVHSRTPPSPNLTTVQNEHFTSIPVSTSSIHVVLYIYRDPVAALYSVQRRFNLSDHFRNIECAKSSATLDTIAEAQQDVIDIGSFDKNYTTFNPARQYRIYCLKYEQFFDHLPEFNRTLGLINYPKLYPVKKEMTRKSGENSAKLETVYEGLKKNMQQRPFIFLS